MFVKRRQYTHYYFFLHSFKQISRIEEAKRAIKRPSDDRYEERESKRSTSDRRFEAPPAPRFDSALSRSSGAYERSAEKGYSGSSSKREEYSKARETYKEVSRSMFTIKNFMKNIFNFFLYSHSAI